MAEGERWVVMGVSGCGKSTVGAMLAARLGLRFIEGDAVGMEVFVRLFLVPTESHRRNIYKYISRGQGRNVRSDCR